MLESKREEQLFHASHNKDGQDTIIFLHGLCSSSSEFSLVVPFIPTKYHILIPDFPGHSRSAGIPLRSFQTVIDHIVDLIKNCAHGGKAHLVGLSFGGFTALTLCAQQPDLVHTCFATGASYPNDTWHMKVAPYVGMAFRPFYKMHGIGTFLHGCPIPPQIIADWKGNDSWAIHKFGFKCLTKEYRRQPVVVRTLLCSGSTRDPIDAMEKHWQILKGEGGNAQNDAVVARGMSHIWDIQAPELFAKLCLAWIERRAYPDGIVPLSEWWNTNN